MNKPMKPTIKIMFVENGEIEMYYYKGKSRSEGSFKEHSIRRGSNQYPIPTYHCFEKNKVPTNPSSISHLLKFFKTYPQYQLVYLSATGKTNQ